MEAMKKAALTKTMETVDDQFKNVLPCYLKIFTPCHGGSAVKTLGSFEFVVPADQKEDFRKAFDNYKKAQDDLAAMG